MSTQIHGNELIKFFIFCEGLIERQEELIFFQDLFNLQKKMTEYVESN